MLVIKRDEKNNLCVSLSIHKTLSNANYLFSFEHIISKEKVRFYPKNVSTSVNRYDEFEFIEGEKPVGYTGDIPYVLFPYPGQYYYSIYEMINTGQTNPQYAFNKLEEGRCFVEDKNEPDVYGYTYTSTNESNSNYVYYDEGRNEDLFIVPLKVNGFNSAANYYNWSIDIPDTLVENLETGVVRRYDTCGYNDGTAITCVDNIFNYYSGETIWQEIKTGSTWPGFKVQFDPDQVISLGYEINRVGTLPSQIITAITINNFRDSFNPALWLADKIQSKLDGSVSTSSILFPKDSDGETGPIPELFFPLSGNNFDYYTYTTNSYTGTSFSEVCYRAYFNQAQYFGRIYYNPLGSNDNIWSINTGSTTSYSLEVCEQVLPSTPIYQAVVSGGITYVGSGSTDTGIFSFVGVCTNDNILTEGGDPLLTEGGDNLII